MTFRQVPLVSELEADGEVINCVPDSGIACMIGAGATIADPSAAGEQVRAAAGYPDAGGTTIERIAPVLTAEWKIPVTIVSTLAALEAAMSPGHAAFVVGNPHAAPEPGPFRRFFPEFDGLHCDALEDGSRGLLVVDPRAAQSSGYTGEPVSWSDVAAFWSGAGADARAGVVALATVHVPTRKVTCGPAPLRASPASSAAVLATVGIGQYVEVLDPSVKGTAWSIAGCGPIRTGSTWIKVRRGVTGYIAAGRFA